MYEAGGAAGLSTSGFAPNISEMAFARDRNLRMQTMGMDAYRESGRVNLFTDMFAKGGQDNIYRRSFQQMMGTVLNMPDVASHFGGSDIDMLFGAQNLVQASGMRIGGTRMFGGGPLSDRIAYDVAVASERFFSPGGISRLERTQGYDRTQIAQVMSIMGQKGAYTDFNLGGNIDMSGGKPVITYDQGATQKVAMATSETLKALRSVQDVVGDRGMQEIINIAQNIAGAAFTSTKQAAKLGVQIQSQMRELKSMSTAFGMSPMAMLQFQGNISEGLTQLGFSGSTGAAFAPEISRVALLQQNVSRAFTDTSNIYTTPTTMAGAAAGMSVRMASLSEDYKMRGYVLGQALMKAGVIKDPGLQKLLLSRNPSDAQLETIYQGVSNFTGGSVDAGLEGLGGYFKALSGLSPEARARVGATSSGLLMDRALDQRLEANLRWTGGTIASITGSTALVDPAIAEQKWLAQKIGRGDQQAAMNIAGGADSPADKLKKLTALYMKSGVSVGEATAAAARHIKQGGWIKDMFNWTTTVMGPDDAFSLNAVDREGMNRVIQSAYAIGEGNTTPVGGFADDMMRAIFGKTTLDNTTLWEYGRMTKATTAFNPGLAITGTTAEKNAQREVVRKILAASNPGLSKERLNSMVEASWGALQSGGDRAGREAESLGTNLNSAGGVAMWLKGRTQMDFLTPEEADKSRESWGQKNQNYALYHLREITGTLTDEVKKQLSDPNAVISDAQYRDTILSAARSESSGVAEGFGALQDKDKISSVLRAQIEEDRKQMAGADEKKKGELEGDISKLQEQLAGLAGGNPMATTLWSWLSKILEAVQKWKPETGA